MPRFKQTIFWVKQHASSVSTQAQRLALFSIRIGLGTLRQQQHRSYEKA
jgi:hypothetical protein